MKTYEDMYKLVTQAILDNFRILPEQLHEDCILKDLDLDSLDMMDLLLILESDYFDTKVDLSNFKHLVPQFLEGTLKEFCTFLLTVINGVCDEFRVS